MPSTGNDAVESRSAGTSAPDWLVLVLCVLLGIGLFYASTSAFPNLFGHTAIGSSTVLVAGIAAGLLVWLSGASSTRVLAASKLRLPLLLATAFVTFPSWGIRQPEMGLDQSWMTAIAIAADQGLMFGRDFVFTYGPLGYVVGRVPPIGHGWVILVHDMALFTELVYWTTYASSRTAHPATCLLGLGAFLAVGAPMYREHAPFLWCVILVLHVAHYMKGASLLHVAFATMISVSLCFGKLNVFPIAIFAGVIALASPAARLNKSRLVALLSIPAYLALLAWCASLLNVDFVSYFVASTRLIVSYADAMYVPIGQVRLWFLLYWELALLALFAGVAGHVLRRSRVDRIVLFTTVMTAGLLFTAFKQGHVRHWGQFLHLSPIVLWLYLVTAPREQQRAAAWPVIAALILATVLLPSHFSAAAVMDKTGAISSYAQDLKRWWREGEVRPRQQVLPTTVRTLIGNRTADVLMYNSSLAVFEDLNYVPRPVIQSYAAYHESLDRLNAEKYESETAPEVLLFEIGAVDDRYWFFDETHTKLAMLRHYEMTQAPGHYRLLERVRKPRELHVEEIGSQAGAIGIPIRLSKEPGTLILAKFDIDYSIQGRLRRLLYQPPALRINFRLASGEVFPYRAIVPIVNGGVIINKFVEDINDFAAFVSGDWPALRDVETITFETPDRWGFRPTYSYSLSRIRLASPSFAPESSSDTVPNWSNLQGDVELLSRTGVLPPRPQDITWQRGPCRAGNVEEVHWISDGKVRATGWAYLEDAKRPADAVLVTLRQAGALIPTAAAVTSIRRGDVVEAFGTGAATVTGWAVDFDLPMAADTLEFWIFNAETRTAYPACAVSGSYQPTP